MASTPTTKSQVQAYRFVLRRMQSALVRRDAVMLHDPMRTHSRATAVGVLLGVIGLLGFLVFGFFKPQPKLDSQTQIAISKETGQVYVVSSNPSQLIPMTNLASARLLWYQRTNPDSGGAAPGATDGGAAPGGSTDGQVAVAGGTPKVVSEAALAKLPRGRLTGIPDAPDTLPAANARIGAAWSVCDTLDLDEFRKNQSEKNEIKTTVIAGTAGADSLLDGDNALLVESKTDKKAYLIYKKPANLTQISSTTVRAEVDLTQDAVKAALKLSGKQPRAISNGLLNAIPEVAPLKAPTIPQQGRDANYLGTAGVKIGEVVEVNRTGTSEFMVVLQDGLQPVEPAVGDLIQATYTGFKKPKSLSGNAVTNALDPKQKLKLDEYPAKVPTVIEANPNNVVVCLGWSADNVKAQNKSENTKVTISAALPGPKDAVPVQINQVGATGEVVDAFIMPAGKAAVIRGTQGAADFGTGPMHIVTGRGVKYGIPDKGTAGALGLGDPADFMPAPEAILRLLPNGPQMNRNDAIRSYDQIPVPKNVGVLPDQQQAANK